ncbi:unnamed protein product [Meloidogyne enterolobii]|uniref:Uncharacterized protein n=1 Tax=Meloidogyne enterolobii TaxID=390850 RepID=A0ACB0YQ10_MELEN
MAFKRALCSLLSSSRIFLSSALRRVARLSFNFSWFNLNFSFVFPPKALSLPVSNPIFCCCEGCSITCCSLSCWSTLLGACRGFKIE